MPAPLLPVERSRPLPPPPLFARSCGVLLGVVDDVVGTGAGPARLLAAAPLVGRPFSRRGFWHLGAFLPGRAQIHAEKRKLRRKRPASPAAARLPPYEAPGVKGQEGPRVHPGPGKPCVSDHLWLTDFRNYRDAEFSPAAEGITVVSGSNGEGKTNLIEAVGYLATLRSLRGSPAEPLREEWCDQRDRDRLPQANATAGGS